MKFINQIINIDCKRGIDQLPDNSIDCVITSPPYWGLRDYGVSGQLGLEVTPQEYVQSLVDIFSRIHRVLKESGTIWLNLGDTYSAHKDCKSISQTIAKDSRSKSAHVIEKGKSVSHDSKVLKSAGLKNKDLIGIPWRVALALQEYGWYLRQDIIWNKPNPMPESVKDRCTKAHEYIFLITKSSRYYFDHRSILEPAKYDGRKDIIMKGSPKYQQVFTGNSPQKLALCPHERWVETKNGIYMRRKRSVWTVPTKPLKEAHFAAYPIELITPCALAGCPENGIILDPFMGAGTTAIVAKQNNRNYVGFELNPDYIEIANKRISTL